MLSEKCISSENCNSTMNVRYNYYWKRTTPGFRCRCHRCRCRYRCPYRCRYRCR